jgi:peptidoglycan hydrolase-like protein with peptidoglycan-binding domain
MDMDVTAFHSRPRVCRRGVAVLAGLTTGLAGLALPSTAAHATAAHATAPVAAVQAAPVTAAQTAAPAAVVAAAGPTLRVGSRGAHVTRLQQRLAALRYDVGAVDGVFGGETLHAVYAFQKVQRLGIDGIVGPATWARLARPKVPKPRHNLRAAAVEVNLTLRVVYLTKSGKVTRIIDASPGKRSTPTVRGNFRFSRRIDGWRRSDLGLLWRPYYFRGGYALHGSKSVPTYAASHGCVRVTMASMNRLWPKLKIGQRIYVYR